MKIPKQRRSHVAMTIPTPEQVAKALGAAPREFKAFVALCAFAGLRLGEAAAIHSSDIETTSHVLAVRRQVQGQMRGKQHIVPPKAGSERDVPIPPSLTDTLTDHLTSVWAPMARRAGSSSQATRCSTATAPATSGA